MAQSLYDTSPSHSFQYYPNTTDPMHSPSAPFSQFHHNMMSNARSAPKQKLSRLELLRNDYNKKLQIERETKLNQLRVQVQQQNNPRQGSTRNGSGVVREFFAERRALEATRKGQKNPELLPPIDSHFKKLKEQKQGSTSTQGFVHDGQLSKTSSAKRKQTNLQHQASQLQQKPLPTKYSTPTKTKGVGHVRKRTKGIDKQDPLPPVNNGSSNAAVKKPPTPNKRYETHSVLEQDPNDVKDDDREQSGHAAYLPVPPIKSNPRIKRPRVPLPPPSNDAFSDQEDGQSTLTDNSNVAPNLSSLKAKALRQRQLSKQRLIASGHVLGGNAKMTDFQKWQTEQNKERDERLDRHRKVSEKSNEPLSQREQEILSKIEEEQTRLQKLKEQRQELEEQEKKQKEEDVKWLVQKQALEETTILPRQESNQDYTLTKATKPRITKPKQPVKPKTQPQRRMSALGSEIEESENIHDNSHHNFYAEQTQDIDVVSVDVSPCSICGRNFATDRLAKHEKVCAKNTASKRKVFNSTKQRNQGTDNEENVMRGKHREEPKKKPKVDWRAQHENFIKAIRYAKGASNEPPPPTENKDYIQCPHCERKFNPATAERHIPKCKDIKARPATLKKKR